MNEQIKKKILNLEPFYEKNLFEKFFSWADLEQLLNLRPFVNDQRFRCLSKEEYSWPEYFWLTDKNSYPPSIVEKCIQENVCYFNDCSRVNERINSLCEELENILDLAADAHIYFDYSGNKSKGFGCHWDKAHNLIVQLEGETNFKIWDLYGLDNLYKATNNLGQKPLIDVTLKTGDAVFVPARMWHQATSETKRLSISFPVWEHKLQEVAFQERKWIKLTDIT